MTETKSSKKYVKVIPLGGLGEIGKNLTVLETDNDIIIIDCGMAFPSEDMLGIDSVIPDITYLEKPEKQEKIRGLFLTHGHEDHIGAIPYLLEKINIPVFGTGLTLGIVEHKLEEKKLIKKAKLQRIYAGQIIEIGDFKIECIHVNHSIADSLAFAIDTPAGKILHTGDFKIDYSPLYDDMTDITRIGELGKEGIRLLLMDSTNAEREGKTNSEMSIRESFDDMFLKYRDKRFTFATFSTNTNRIQTIFNLSKKYDRKVALTGRSMLNIIDVAMERGYIEIPEDTLIDIEDVHTYKPEELVIITTGSQGEPMSALYRMATGDHKQVQLGTQDVVVISANAIPGNEKSVNKIINDLLELGVTIMHDKKASVHVSGHGCQDELTLIHTLVKPQYFMPVHGETRHLLAQKNLAIKLGMDPDNIFISANGKILILTENTCQFLGEVPSGITYVQGNGVGDIGNIVIRDRNTLSENGIVISIITIDNKKMKLVAGPDIISRGFVYVNESEELMKQLRKITKEETLKCLDAKNNDWNEIKTNIKNALQKYIYSKTRRSPMILPVIISV